jgi:hypothetical protein
MKRALVIDDIRNEDHIGLDTLHPTQDILIARNYEMGKQALTHLGPWDILYLDHDLGEGKNGYQIIEWLEEQLFNNNLNFLPKELIVISSNPVGIEKINKGWQAIQARISGI